jgi:hypothetical protein
MTEQEWLAENPYPRQLAVLHRFATVRKLLLIAAAYVRGAQARPEYVDAKPCDDLIEIAADRLWPSEDIAHALAARPGHWGFTHVLAVPQEPAAVAKGLRHLASAYKSNSARTVPELIRLIHEVTANPFRPVTINPTWLTSTVLQLAAGIYSDRAFDRLPILADALQDAGCDNEDVLNHCRSEGPHVRGCWVVDLLLGKE